MLKSEREEVDLIKKNDKGQIHKNLLKRRRGARQDAQAAMQQKISLMNALNSTAPSNKAESTDRYVPSESGGRSTHSGQKR